MKRILFKSLVASTLVILGLGFTACKYGANLGDLESISVESKIYFTETNKVLKQSDIKVTAHYVGGNTANITQFSIDEILPYEFNEDGAKEFTVTVDGKQASFTAYKVSQTLTETPVLLNDYVPVYESEFNSGVYYKYGDYPQNEISESEASLIQFESEPAPNGWYVGKKDNKCEFYGKVGSKYYKLEPIVWRQLTADYKGTGNSLFMAENILTGNIPYYISKNDRVIDEKVIDAKSYTYSTLRAYLNGYDYYDDSSERVLEFKDKNFLSQAFSSDDSRIVITNVANDGDSSDAADSDNWSRIDGQKHGGDSTGCIDLSEDSTLDKVFVLSIAELNNSDYNFEKGSTYSGSTVSVLSRSATPYAKATGVIDGSENPTGSVTWFTRTPYYKTDKKIRSVTYGGYSFLTGSVDSTDIGIVPAIVVDLN